MAGKIKIEELSDGELADRTGAVKTRGDEAGEALDALKAEFDRRKLDFAKGEKFKVTRDASTQERFDVKAARESMGEAAKAFVKTVPIVKYFVRPVEA